jgi:phosphate:Na+ symporter
LEAVFAGAGITAILQSSSMVVLLVMSFAGAGIIGLNNGIGIILGANLGTTAKGWLISWLGFKTNIQALILPLMALGGAGALFIKQPRPLHISKFVLGFSFMFLGLDIMNEGVNSVVEHVDLSVLQNQPHMIFFLFALCLTALIQSSSASVMIFLSALSAGLVTYEQSLYLVIGADLGTTVTALLGTIKSNAIRKKVGWSQIYINLIVAGIGLAGMPVFIKIIRDWLSISDNLTGLVAFHSLLNIIGIIFILPFTPKLADFLDKFIKVGASTFSMYISKNNLQKTTYSLDALTQEAQRFIFLAVQVNRTFFDIQVLKLKDVLSYEDLKSYENEVIKFYRNLQYQNLNETQQIIANSLITSIRHAGQSTKNIKDIIHNIEELKKIASDDYYRFYLNIIAYQDKFYDVLEDEFFTNDLPSDKIHEKLLLLKKYMVRHEEEEIYKLVEKASSEEMSISSLLNMIKEINSSNKEFLKALHHLSIPHENNGLQSDQIRESFTNE